MLSVILTIFYFRKFVGRSIKDIVSYADQIKQGNYDVKAPRVQESELKHLINVLNLAVHKIKMRETELLNSHEVLENRVIERTAELQSAKEQAESASQVKTQFLSSMSHELRTPLNAILGFTQLIEMNDNIGDDDDNVQEIKRAGHHLLDLVNQILDLSQIESGRLNLKIENVPINTTIEKCISLVENSLSNVFNISVELVKQEPDYIVLADKVRLNQVFINLLNNALKYNRENGSVKVSIEKDGADQIKVLITDTGVGISPDNIERLFEPFERLEFKNGNIEGSGIGLTVTRQLITAMKGEIGVKSEEGVGSTFWVTLKLENGIQDSRS